MAIKFVQRGHAQWFQYNIGSQTFVFCLTRLEGEVKGCRTHVEKAQTVVKVCTYI
ncbi:MAG: hypothetical protein BWY75_02489 [bacterium ADurb.Bin425]|nr:MAG: hypothetical protein BWY75_02489 [bacterium ADurb.Bin425]